jgi:Na+/H+-dicarboxylate symporter
VLLAALWHSAINLPLLARLFGSRDLWRYFLATKEAPLVALATASSAATLPVSMRVSQKAGIDRAKGALLLPLGASLNMDGSALYHAVVVLFLMLLSGVEPGLGTTLLVVMLVMLSSAGTSAIPGGGVAMLAMISAILGIDPLWLGFYLLIDRFLDNIITSVNVWGDLVALKSMKQAT